jgi:hypothetical protein
VSRPPSLIEQETAGDGRCFSALQGQDPKPQGWLGQKQRRVLEVRAPEVRRHHLTAVLAAEGSDP